MSDEPPQGADSLMHVRGKPWTETIDGKKWTLTPLPIMEVMAEAESRIRSGLIETYLRGALPAGVGEEERTRHVRQLEFDPLGTVGGKPLSRADGNGAATEDEEDDAAQEVILSWMQTPAGVNFFIWRALKPHHPNTTEDALPFTVAERMALYRRILERSGFTPPEDEYEKSLPPASAPRVNGSRRGKHSGKSKKVTTGG